MNLRRTHATGVAAAKAGFSRATGYRIVANEAREAAPPAPKSRPATNHGSARPSAAAKSSLCMADPSRVMCGPRSVPAPRRRRIPAPLRTRPRRPAPNRPGPTPTEWRRQLRRNLEPVESVESPHADAVSPSGGAPPAEPALGTRPRFGGGNRSARRARSWCSALAAARPPGNRLPCVSQVVQRERPVRFDGRFAFGVEPQEDIHHRVAVRPGTPQRIRGPARVARKDQRP